MALPQFLLVDDSYADVQSFITLVKRIGLVNTVLPVGTIEEARHILANGASSTLPVVVFCGGAVRDGHGDDLLAWLDDQPQPLAALPRIALVKPLEMYAVIGALKALALPERARIDATTLTVRVELWPRGTILTDG